jgi:hypothetical protein
MRYDMNGHVAMLDQETQETITAARERLFGRFRDRIDALDVRVDHVANTGNILCQVTVRTANRIQFLVRHRDRDALKAVLIALERTRAQIGRALAPKRRRTLGGVSAATP